MKTLANDVMYLYLVLVVVGAVVRWFRDACQESGFQDGTSQVLRIRLPPHTIGYVVPDVFDSLAIRGTMVLANLPRQ
jgi:hypothetical protein